MRDVPTPLLRLILGFSRPVIVCLCVLLAGLATVPAHAQSHNRAEIEVLAEYYAGYYGVPLALVRRVINRESTFNPSARNGPYYGLMQILPATARTMGYSGSPEGLLNAETNLIYAVKYLRGAWLLASGSHDRAVRLYAAGYYYDARDAGMLEATGLRPGPSTLPTPQPVGVEIAIASIAPQPQAASTGGPTTLLSMFGGGNPPTSPAAPEPAVSVAAPPVPLPGSGPDADGLALDEDEEAVLVAVALVGAPPRRPEGIALPEMAVDPIIVAAIPEAPVVEETAPALTAVADLAEEAAPAAGGDALLALAAVAPGGATVTIDPAMAQLERGLEWASAYAELRPAFSLDADADMLDATFALLDPVQSLMVQASLAAGADGFMPPRRPE